MKTIKIHVIPNKKYILYSLAELERKYGAGSKEIEPVIVDNMIEDIWKNNRDISPIITVRSIIELNAYCEGWKEPIICDLFSVKETANTWSFASWMIKSSVGMENLKLSSQFKRFKLIKKKLKEIKKEV